MITITETKVAAWDLPTGRHELRDAVEVVLIHPKGTVPLFTLFEEDLDGNESLCDAAERWIIAYMLDVESGRYRSGPELAAIVGYPKKKRKTDLELIQEMFPRPPRKPKQREKGKRKKASLR